MAFTRKSLVETIEGYDGEIDALQLSKRQTYDDHRKDLLGSMSKEDARAEIDAIKKAIQRRRQVKRDGAEAVEARDELVEEILAELADQRAARHTHVAHSVPTRAEEAARLLAAHEAERQHIIEDVREHLLAHSVATMQAADHGSASVTPPSQGAAVTSSQSEPVTPFDTPFATHGGEASVALIPENVVAPVALPAAGGPSEDSVSIPRQEGQQSAGKTGGGSVPPPAPGPLERLAAKGFEGLGPKPDYSKPNPDCKDPDDCGVYASWNHLCIACVKARNARLAHSGAAA